MKNVIKTIKLGRIIIPKAVKKYLNYVNTMSINEAFNKTFNYIRKETNVNLKEEI